MSLQAIRDMRMQRKKPADVLTVVIGEAPQFWKDDASLIELRPGCQPTMLDWRPVVGLWTAFYMLKPDWTVMDAAIGSAHAAGAKLFGFVHAGVGYPLALAIDQNDKKFNNDARQRLQEIWESLCK